MVQKNMNIDMTSTKIPEIGQLITYKHVNLLIDPFWLMKLIYWYIQWNIIQNNDKANLKKIVNSLVNILEKIREKSEQWPTSNVIPYDEETKIVKRLFTRIFIGTKKLVEVSTSKVETDKKVSFYVSRICQITHFLCKWRWLSGLSEIALNIKYIISHEKANEIKYLINKGFPYLKNPDDTSSLFVIVPTVTEEMEVIKKRVNHAMSIYKYANIRVLENELKHIYIFISLPNIMEWQNAVSILKCIYPRDEESKKIIAITSLLKLNNIYKQLYLPFLIPLKINKEIFFKGEKEEEKEKEKEINKRDNVGLSTRLKSVRPKKRQRVILVE